jgi:hypothetical protein
MVDFGKLTDRVKKVVAQRGGTDSVKEDAGELRDIAQSDGSVTDKAKHAAEALREPGAHPAASDAGDVAGSDSGADRAGEG